jgi:hypothetical protein
LRLYQTRRCFGGNSFKRRCDTALRPFGIDASPQALELIGVEELFDRNHSLPRQVESVRLLLVFADGCADGEQVFRYRFELRLISILVIELLACRVALPS